MDRRLLPAWTMVAAMPLALGLSSVPMAAAQEVVLASASITTAPYTSTRRSVVEETAPPPRPLTVTMTAPLDFARLAVRGGGAVAVEPGGSGRRLSGDIVDLGGPALSGAVTVTGEPGRAIIVRLPHRIELRAPGRPALIVDQLTTDISANPVIGADGRLSFRFGGQLRLGAGEAFDGAYRGQVSISVDYL